ncbi:PE family protein, partial [Mycobacterium ulcerans]|uniref:PE family protein n=1 Tax=Mycobacterium ulcerans TaxID=1809 RepID=UPI00214CBB3A
MAINAGSTAAAASTTEVAAAAADEISTAVAELFGAYARGYQIIGAQAAMFHAEFVRALDIGAGAYWATEVANASPLQSLEQQLLATINAPTQTLLGRPLIGNGTTAQPAPARAAAPANCSTAAAGQRIRRHRPPRARWECRPVRQRRQRRRRRHAVIPAATAVWAGGGRRRQLARYPPAHRLPPEPPAAPISASPAHPAGPGTTESAPRPSASPAVRAVPAATATTWEVSAAPGAPAGGGAGGGGGGAGPPPPPLLKTPSPPGKREKRMAAFAWKKKKKKKVK